MASAAVTLETDIEVDRKTRSTPPIGRAIRFSKKDNLSDKVRRKMEEYDTNHDGCVDIENVHAIIKSLVKEEKRSRMLKWGISGLFLFTIMLLGSTFGLTWFAVSTLKDTKINNNILVTKDGTQVQVSGTDYIVRNDTLYPRDTVQQNMMNPAAVMRTSTFVGTPFTLTHTDIDVDVLMEMNYMVLSNPLASTNLSLRVDGVAKYNDMIVIMTPLGNINYSENGTTYDGKLSEYMSISSDTDQGQNQSQSQNSSQRRLLAQTSDSTGGQHAMIGYFGHVRKPSVFDDGKWWRISSQDKQGVLYNTRKLVGAIDNTDIYVSFDRAWSNYKKTYAKLYDPEEENYRFASFKQNMMLVADVNKNARLNWWAGGNPYTDMPFDEFNRSVLMQVVPDTDSTRYLNRRRYLITTTVSDASAIPNLVDWRASGKVSSVKHQGNCGSCWAFTAIAAIESAYLIHTNTNASSAQNMDFSEQNLVSCASTTNTGCIGGSTWDALEYIANHNVTTERLYPYMATGSPCATSIVSNTNRSNVYQSSGLPTFINENSETALMIAVSRQPVISYIMVDKTLVSYAGGIYYPSTCTNAVNHAVVVVGYDKINKWWLIKNSWGPTWGEGGFARIAMTGDGTTGPCGMYQYSMMPTLSNVPITVVNVVNVADVVNTTSSPTSHTQLSPSSLSSPIAAPKSPNRNQRKTP